VSIAPPPITTHNKKAFACIIERDLTRDEQQESRQLRDIMFVAKRQGLKAFVRDTTLVVAGLSYTVSTLSSLPSSLADAARGWLQDDHTVAFFNGIKKGNLISNHNEEYSSFILDTDKYENTEEYLGILQGNTMGDKASVEKIRNLAVKDPKVIKGIMNKMTGNKDLWLSKCEILCRPGLTAKFVQNVESAELLLSTGSKHLVEANPTDKNWGVAMSTSHPDILDHTKYPPGSNILGRVLMYVRDEVLRLMPQFQEFIKQLENMPALA
jgi:hypothetical protein